MLARVSRGAGGGLLGRLAAAVAVGSLAAAAANGQPVNDDCANAIPLTLDLPVMATQTDAVPLPTSTSLTPCTPGQYDRHTYYTFTPPTANTRYRIRLFDNLNAGGVLTVHSECPTTGATAIACHGPTGVVDEFVDFQSDATASPVVVVYSTIPTSFDAGSPYTIVAEESPPVPPHNDCSLAMPISLDETITDDNTGCILTPTPVSNTCIISSGGMNVLWYTFTPPQPNTMYRARGFTLTPNQSTLISTHDLVIAPFVACGLPAGDELFCSDNGRDTFADFRSDSLASPMLIMVGTRSFYETQYQVWVEEAPAPPDNAACEDAAPVGLGQFVFGTTAGSLQDVDIDSCGLAGTDNRRTAWYVFSPPDPNTDYTIETFGASANITLSAWADCSGLPASEIGCSDAQQTNDTRLDFTSDGGASAVLIRIASQSTAEATFEVQVVETVPVPGDTCADAVAIPSLPYVSDDFDTAGYVPTLPPMPCHPFALFVTDTPKSLWHTITPATDTTVLFEADTSYTRKDIMLLSGDCASLSVLDCSYLQSSAPVSLQADLAAGVTYYVVVGDANLPGLNTGGFVTVTATEVLPPPCACEFDGTAGVNVFDLLAYLDLWFPSDAAADLDGTPGVDVFDLLFYLDCWFPASAGNPCP